MTVGGGGGGVASGAGQTEQASLSEIQALAQLKDFFGGGLSDDIGRKALDSAKASTGNYDVQFAVNWLLDQNASVLGATQHAGAGTPNATGPPNFSANVQRQAPPKTAQKESNMIAKISAGNRQANVSVSEDTELQKAIALSLSDQSQHKNQQQTPLGLGGQISAEEQELSKVIEASIAESKKGHSHDLRQSSLFFVDPANPHERERLGAWPVGLKNVGNTCWFSVVIQALFHFPVFRRRLINADFDVALQNRQPAEAATTSQVSSAATSPREVEFAVELRKLFALMLASRRKYVDPSGAVDVLRKQDSLQLRNIGGLDSGQQDVSEFTHLLLEWLEEAFKLVSPPDATVTKSPIREPDETAGHSMEVDVAFQRENAIEQLFYGTVVKESFLKSAATGDAENNSNVRDGQLLPAKEEPFSQYPLQVIGCETLHDSMERSLRPEDSPEVENWLERLPPVFLFELTRFQYNQMDRKPEKIHSQFRFPKVLYVDRYLRANKISVREKRGYLGQLRQQLNALRYQLQKLENYCGSKMPLANVLSLTLNFIGRGDDVSSVSCESEPMEESDHEPANDEVSGDARWPPLLVRPVDACDAELEVMERCLRRWRSHFLERVEELKVKIREVEEKIEQVYCEPRFQQHPYVLHAILVHEGQATLGHYWAFVGDRSTNKWLKFNDVQVTDVSFEEVERDSVGGFQSSSAYCLFYVDVRRSDLFEDLGNVTEAQLLSSLPTDLQHYVSDDNVKFTTELHDWDRKHSAAATPSAPAASPTGASSLRSSVQSINESELTSIVEEHSRLCARHILRHVEECLKSLHVDGRATELPAEKLLEKLIEDKLSSTKQEGDDFLSKQSVDGNLSPKWHACTDVRPHNWLPFFAYCWIRCGGGNDCGSFDSTKVLRRILLDYFANSALVALVNSPLSGRLTEIYQAAKRAIASDPGLMPTELQVYARIHCDYKLYLETILLLSYALERLQGGAYVAAFQAASLAKAHAERLSSVSSYAGAVDFDFVLQCIRVIIMHLSEQTVKEVMVSTDEKEITEKLRLMRSQVLPCLTNLCRRYNDTATLETVRAGWFVAATEEKNHLSKSSINELNSFLDALSEVEGTTMGGAGLLAMNAKIKLQPDIGPRYMTALRVAREFGILQCHGLSAERQTPSGE